MHFAFSLPLRGETVESNDNEYAEKLMRHLLLGAVLAATMLLPAGAAQAANPQEIATACAQTVEAAFRPETPGDVLNTLRSTCESGLADAAAALDIPGACARYSGQVPPELMAAAQAICQEASARL